MTARGEIFSYQPVLSENQLLISIRVHDPDIG